MDDLPQALEWTRMIDESLTISIALSGHLVCACVNTCLIIAIAKYSASTEYLFVPIRIQVSQVDVLRKLSLVGYILFISVGITTSKCTKTH